jgi:hypothetical protein
MYSFCSTFRYISPMLFQIADVLYRLWFVLHTVTAHEPYPVSLLLRIVIRARTGHH